MSFAAAADYEIENTLEAGDAVQEGWLRLSRSDASSMGNLGRWLPTVVARESCCARARRGATRGRPFSVIGLR